MTNLNIPINEASIWDIVDWDVVGRLSADAPNRKEDLNESNVLAWFARELIEAGSRSDREAETMLHRVAVRWIGHAGQPAERRFKALKLAVQLGANPERFILWIAYKWGLFKS